MSQYSASVPSDGQVKPSIKSFFERFYEVSDNPTGHEQYADMFTSNAKLIMGLNEVSGREGKPTVHCNHPPNLKPATAIIKMRHGMWEKVAKRDHKPAQIYSFGSGSNDVMLYGTVGYTLKDGKGTTVDWAAKAHFVEEGGSLLMDFYQVYLVCGFPTSYLNITDQFIGLCCDGSSEIVTRIFQKIQSCCVQH